MKRMTFLPHPNSDEMASTGGVADPTGIDSTEQTSAAAADDTKQAEDPATMAQGDGDDGTKNG